MYIDFIGIQQHTKKVKIHRNVIFFAARALVRCAHLGGKSIRSRQVCRMSDCSSHEIESMEAREADRVMQNTLLPIEGLDKAMLEARGVVFGKENGLYIKADLPPGWEIAKQTPRDPRHMELRDSSGVVLLTMFVKKTPYSYVADTAMRIAK
jgi:hypothetical protein